MGDLGCLSGSDGRSGDQFPVGSEACVVGAEAIDDAALLQVVRRHLYFHTVTGEDADLIHTHASGQMTEKFVILGLVGCDADSERRVGITLLYDADEFDDIFGHR